MTRKKIYIHSSLLTALLFILTIQYSHEWERKLTLSPAYRLKDNLKTHQSRYKGQADGRVIINPPLINIARAQGSGNYGGGKSASQKVWLKNNVYHAKYKFLNFNSDRLSIYFGMKKANYRRYLKSYNYTDTALANLRSWRDK